MSMFTAEEQIVANPPAQGVFKLRYNGKDHVAFNHVVFGMSWPICGDEFKVGGQVFKRDPREPLTIWVKPAPGGAVTYV